MATEETIRVFATDVGVNPAISGAENVQDALAAGAREPGAAIVRKFPFAFNDAGLAAGKTIYVPTVNDVLLDAWVQVDTAWDGATPRCDIGTFSGSTAGLYGQLISLPLSLNGQDVLIVGTGVAVGAAGPSLSG